VTHRILLLGNEAGLQRLLAAAGYDVVALEGASQNVAVSERVRAVLDDLGVSAILVGGAADAARPAVLRLDGIALDAAGRSVRRGDAAIDVTTVEFEMLRLLLEAAGRPVTREALMEGALGRRYDPTDRSVDMHISNLRRKLGPRADGGARIATVRGVGYVYTLPSGG
jgi:DNA-binding response OmpR family regulator